MQSVFLIKGNVKMEHIVKFEAGYNCIDFKCINDSKNCIPRTGGSHGIAGLSIRFISKGPEGAVQFLLYTGLIPKRSKISEISFGTTTKMMPADLGYHSKKPIYRDQPTCQDSCEWCDGQPCYYDGSGLNAKYPFESLINAGEEGLWKFLDAYYQCVFFDADFPKVTKYCKSPSKLCQNGEF